MASMSSPRQGSWAAAPQGLAPGPAASVSPRSFLSSQPDESVQTVGPGFRCRDPHQLPEELAGNSPGTMKDDEALPPCVEKTEDRKSGDTRSAKTGVLPQEHGSSTSWPALGNGLVMASSIFLAPSLSSATSTRPLGSLLQSPVVLPNSVQQQQHGTQRAKTPGLLSKLETADNPIHCDQNKVKKSSELSSATVQSKNIVVASPVKKNSKTLGLSGINAEIIQIQPVIGNGLQQFFLYNPNEPTVQLLLQSPLPPLGQVSVDKIITGGQKNKSVKKSEDSANVSSISACSANVLANNEKKQKGQKDKKSLKVTTRSGRISHPPKYKVKDYKFIKTEDLADCHLSDSDDYSELNLEDDEVSRKKEVFNLWNCDLRPKLFKCDHCEKSYIGKGGLSRHYKLNPGHGQQRPLESSPITSFSTITALECPEKAACESIHQAFSSSPVTLALVNRNGLASELEKKLPSENEQRPDVSAEDRKNTEKYSNHLLHLKPVRNKQRRRCGQSKMLTRSRYSRRFSKSHPFSSNSLNNTSVEHLSIFRRKARIKEVIQQCSNEDLMELVVPRITKLITVFDFLLMKAEKKCRAKALFPDVYKEFEELHSMVKRECQDYFNNPELKEPIEIKMCEVAQSLGITGSFLAEQKNHTDSFPEATEFIGECILPQISGQKQEVENSNEKLLKIAREENVLEKMDIEYSNQTGTKGKNHAYQDEIYVESSCSENKAWEKD